MQPDLNLWFQAFNTLGTIGLLILIVILFYRGDLLSRPVYTQLVENIVETTVRRVVEELRPLLIRSSDEDKKGE